VAENGPNGSIDGQPPVRAEQDPAGDSLRGARGARRTGHEAPAIGIAGNDLRRTAVELHDPEVIAGGADFMDDHGPPLLVETQHGLAGNVVEDDDGVIPEIHGQERAGESAAGAMDDQAVAAEPDEVAESRVRHDTNRAAERVEDAEAARDLAA